MRSRPLQDLLLPQAHFLYLQLQQCNKTSRGVQVLYSNRKGNDMQVICLKEGVKHRWKSVDAKILKWNVSNAYCMYMLLFCKQVGFFDVSGAAITSH